jgi:hypothetical protein
MGIQTFPVAVATTITTLSIAHAMTTNTTTKQPSVFEDPKHYNTDEALLLQRRIQ